MNVKDIISKPVIVYCDGGCSPNPGPGAWGWYIPESEEENSGYKSNTTNNEMELLAIHMALQEVAHNHLVVFTDSLYAIEAISGRNYSKANSRLVHEISRLKAERKLTGDSIEIVKVPGRENLAHALVQATRERHDPPKRRGMTFTF